jgi:hypothetical protein
MLVTGCAIKSINDRGVNSNAVAKIKHQSDHILDTKNTVGRITETLKILLEELLY